MFNRTVALISSSVASALAAMQSFHPMGLIIQQVKNQFYRDPSAFKRSSLRVRTGMRYPHSSDRQNKRTAAAAKRIEESRSANSTILMSHVPANSGPGMDISKPSRQVKRAEVRRMAKNAASRFRKMNRTSKYGVTSIDWRTYNDDILMPPKAEVQA